MQQEIARIETEADDYISHYNIHLDHVVMGDGPPMFRKGLKLISHWGLRDELRGLYSDAAANLQKQRTIARIMERIIRQEIPAVVIDSAGHRWDPWTNLVDGKTAPSEEDRRYLRLVNPMSSRVLRPFNARMTSFNTGL